MSIPTGLKVTTLVNGLDLASLSTGEAQILEEEMDGLNTEYKGYGYARDLSNNNQQPIIVLSEPIEKKDWTLYSGVDASSQWKALIDGKTIQKAYLEIEFGGIEKRTMQFAFVVSQDFIEWVKAVIRMRGTIGIMDRLDMIHPIGAIQVTGIPLDMPKLIIKSERG